MPRLQSRRLVQRAAPYLALPLLLLVVSACAPLTYTERSTVRSWLLCEECIDAERESAVAIGKRAVPTFAEGLLQGPTLVQRDNVRRQIISAYGRLVAFAGAGSLPITQAEYVNHYLANYIATYQARSADALRRIGGSAARRALRQAMAQDSVYRADVRLAIRRALVVRVSIHAGNGQSVALGSTLPVNAAVAVRDSVGAPLPNTTVTFRTTAGGVLTDYVRTTDAAGIATIGSWTLGPSLGAQELYAAVGDTTVIFVATAVPGTPFLWVSGGNQQRAAAGMPVRIRPAVRALDGSGNAVTGVAVSFTVTAGAGSIGGSPAVTDGNGVATSGNWELGPVPGTNQVRAEAAGYRSITLTAMGTLPLRRVAAGGAHSCALSPDPPPDDKSLVYCWGANDLGQLGIGSNTSRNAPTLIPATGFRLLAITGGLRHTCGITLPLGAAVAGIAFCWGNNAEGQVGDGTGTTRTNPVLVTNVPGTGFTAIAAGAQHTCALAMGGAVYCWGRNDAGQLGDSSTVNRLAAVPVKGGLLFRSISSGDAHSCGLTSDSAAYCWGRNDGGQLGNNTVVNSPIPVRVTGILRFVSVAAGDRHSCATASDPSGPGQRTYCWGQNESGQLGDGTTTNRPLAVAVAGGRAFQQLSAGGAHTCGRASDTLAFCWGRNDIGQVGDGTNTTRLAPVAVAGGLAMVQISARGGHTCASTGRREVYCWGRNVSGQLGDGTSLSRNVPTRVVEPQFAAAPTPMYLYYLLRLPPRRGHLRVASP